MRLADKVAIISGAASGMGAASPGSHRRFRAEFEARGACGSQRAWYLASSALRRRALSKISNPSR